jgi:hypothetical protein
MKRLMLLSVLTLVCACSGKSDEAAAPQASAPATDTAHAAPSASKEPTAEQVPVPSDFAEQARASITRANYRAELSALTQEIEGDTAR